MNKHEVEALQEIIDLWGRHAPALGTVSTTVMDEKAQSIEKCMSDLQEFLDSLTAPDDGLREGLEEIKRNWRGVVYGLNEEGREDAAAEIAGCVFEIEDLLAKTPDAWRPIADAPRDGREIIGWFIAGGKEREDFIKWDNSVLATGMWKNRYGHYWGDACFEWWREKPAPPREGKECES